MSLPSYEAQSWDPAFQNHTVLPTTLVTRSCALLPSLRPPQSSPCRAAGACAKRLLARGHCHHLHLLPTSPPTGAPELSPAPQEDVAIRCGKKATLCARISTHGHVPAHTVDIRVHAMYALHMLWACLHSQHILAHANDMPTHAHTTDAREGH